jgi:hypothetical protein
MDYMNKFIILFFMTIFGLLGNFAPILFGINDLFSVWGILGGIFGGFFGIWVGYVVSKKIG